MSSLKNIAISIGDINGVGFEIALKSHNTTKTLCNPIYCIGYDMATKAANLLGMTLPDDFKTIDLAGNFDIKIGEIDAESGLYSYDSFIYAVSLAKHKIADAIVTLPIHKEAWSRGGIEFVGHTDALREIFSADAIMMLGCEKLFVALYSEHIPLRSVANSLTLENFSLFLKNLSKNINHKPIAVLGLNPHAGDGGVLGDEEDIITKAIESVNYELGDDIFIGPLVPDTAFTPLMRERYSVFVALYHDQGLAPLKALYFDESINISLNLPIIRTSVDHGTAFDIAYKNIASNISYINAIKAAIDFSKS